MSSDTYVHILLAVLSGVFSAGVVYTWVRLSITHLEERASAIHRDLNTKIDKNFETQQKALEENYEQLQGDLSGIGHKVSNNERQSARRYHNVSIALQYGVKSSKEKEISRLLREF